MRDDAYDMPVLTLVTPLRKCSRCGHSPCPCCGSWCDVLDADGSDGCESISCPCGNEMRCTFMPEDEAVNQQTLATFFEFSAALHCSGSGETPEGRPELYLDEENWIPETLAAYRAQDAVRSDG